MRGLTVTAPGRVVFTAPAPSVDLRLKLMALPELGPWDPLTLKDAIDVFDEARFRWWISGGQALELHTGRSWRDHADTDVGLVRHDVADLPMVLVGWDIYLAAAGRLDVWHGQTPRRELHQNNLWCRRRPAEPWALDVTIGEGDRDTWIYRRDPRLRVPWEEAVLETTDGVPYLAPDLQLLFKSNNRRDKDDVDARQVIPELGAERRDLLASLLPGSHPWQRLLSTTGP